MTGFISCNGNERARKYPSKAVPAPPKRSAIPEKSCHCEEAKPTWQSPGILRPRSTARRPAPVQRDRGTKRSAPQTGRKRQIGGLPHQSADWFAMTARGAASVCGQVRVRGQTERGGDSASLTSTAPASPARPRRPQPGSPRSASRAARRGRASGSVPASPPSESWQRRS